MCIILTLTYVSCEKRIRVAKVALQVMTMKKIIVQLEHHNPVEFLLEWCNVYDQLSWANLTLLSGRLLLVQKLGFTLSASLPCGMQAKGQNYLALFEPFSEIWKAPRQAQNIQERQGVGGPDNECLFSDASASDAFESYCRASHVLFYFFFFIARRHKTTRGQDRATEPKPSSDTDLVTTKSSTTTQYTTAYFRASAYFRSASNLVKSWEIRR